MLDFLFPEIPEWHEESLLDSDLVLVFTKWSEFKSLDGNFLKKFMNKPLIIDGRGFLEKEKIPRWYLL